MFHQARYELDELERLIASPDKTDHSVDPLLIDSEVQRIKRAFNTEILTFGDEKHLERYVQHHQQALVRLMDNLPDHLKPDRAVAPELFDTVYNALDDLLRFIEKHFTRYFDQDAKAPEAYISIVRRDTKRAHAKLKIALGNLNADPSLVDAVLYILRKVSSTRNKQPLTYRRVMYSAEVKEEVIKIIKSGTDSLEEDLRMLTFYLNYNSIKVFIYHARAFDKLLSGNTDRMSKIEKLSFALKKINQVQVKPGISYSNRASSLKEQICTYLSEEIEYLSRLQQLGLPSRAGEVTTDTFKLKMNLSVSQLAYLVKLLVDSHIVQNKNLTEVLRFIARTTITKKAETISFDSIRAKYYNVESGTRDSVRNLLFEMIRHVDTS